MVTLAAISAMLCCARSDEGNEVDSAAQETRVAANAASRERFIIEGTQVSGEPAGAREDKVKGKGLPAISAARAGQRGPHSLLGAQVSLSVA